MEGFFTAENISNLLNISLLLWIFILAAKLGYTLYEASKEERNERNRILEARIFASMHPNGELRKYIHVKKKGKKRRKKKIKINVKKSLYKEKDEVEIMNESL